MEHVDIPFALATGKTVAEGILELIQKNDVNKLIIPGTYHDKEFEIEVRVKND